MPRLHSRTHSADAPIWQRSGMEVVMRVRDIMTKEVETVPPTATVHEAWSLMREKRIRHLVVTKDGNVVGVVSDRDVRLPSFFGEPLTEVMTDPAITIGPN